ncbi:transposable element Tcb2 transposase [Trichonephila clavipes]|nr:transposable element Tcb2 transposase [Trichonephila clavipes]
MLGSRTDLHIFDAGSVNGTRYCNEILLPYVRLFRGAMGLQFLFMDDNAPCHRTVAAEQLLESEDIERMDWPSDDNNVCSGSGGSINTGKCTFPPLQHKPGVSPLNFIALQIWQQRDVHYEKSGNGKKRLLRPSVTQKRSRVGRMLPKEPFFVVKKIKFNSDYLPGKDEKHVATHKGTSHSAHM